MIIKYMWFTHSELKRPIPYKAKFLTDKFTDWEGWFLFGLIPLYIRASKFEYR